VSSLNPGNPRTRALLAVKHAALAAAVGTGMALMLLRGWGLGQHRWLGVKIGLVVLLILPLEGFGAYLTHGFLPRARRLAGEAGARQVERGEGMASIVRTFELTLFTIAIPLILWLSLRRPF
jgi:hypothetical protein